MVLAFVITLIVLYASVLIMSAVATITTAIDGDYKDAFVYWCVTLIMAAIGFFVSSLFIGF